MQNDIYKCYLKIILGGAFFAAVIGFFTPYWGSRLDSLSGMLGGAAIGAVGALAGIFRYGTCDQQDEA